MWKGFPSYNSSKPNLTKVLFVFHRTPQHIHKRTLASTLVFINRGRSSQVLVSKFCRLSAFSAPYYIELFRNFRHAQWFQLMQANLILMTLNNGGWQSESRVRVTFLKSHHQINSASYKTWNIYYEKLVIACSVKMMKFHLSVVSNSPTLLFMKSLLVSDTIIFWK